MPLLVLAGHGDDACLTRKPIPDRRLPYHIPTGIGRPIERKLIRTVTVIIARNRNDRRLLTRNREPNRILARHIPPAIARPIEPELVRTVTVIIRQAPERSPPHPQTHTRPKTAQSHTSGHCWADRTRTRRHRHRHNRPGTGMIADSSPAIENPTEFWPGTYHRPFDDR